jgi:hypothetical protein
MRVMAASRIALAACGLAAGAYGLVLLIQTGLANIAHTVPWLIGGVVADDAVVAPATIVVAVLAARLVPRWLRGPATVGVVVLGSLTLIAVPVLGGFGTQPDNATVLDRDYTAGWLAVAAVTAAGVAVGAVLRRRALRRAADDGALDDGG